MTQKGNFPWGFYAVAVGTILALIIWALVSC